MTKFAMNISGDLTETQTQAFQYMMDVMAEQQLKEIEQVMLENNCSEFCAMDIVYLRTRSRYTPELEQELVRLHQIGQAPNICEWP